MNIPAKLYIKLLLASAPQMLDNEKYKRAVRAAADYFDEQGDEGLGLFCLAQIGDVDIIETTDM